MNIKESNEKNVFKNSKFLICYGSENLNEQNLGAFIISPNSIDVIVRRDHYCSIHNNNDIDPSIKKKFLSGLRKMNIYKKQLYDENAPFSKLIGDDFNDFVTKYNEVASKKQREGGLESLKSLVMPETVIAIGSKVLKAQNVKNN